ncbi:MAG TPA: ABC transporter ATP-binding protein [Mycobacteriales bacterium]|nr:ABC transporter ATP-binding protein [Mycobacteriales bacterium]
MSAPTGGDHLLEVEGLEVFFDLPNGELHAVQGVDLALDAGERLAIVGESGSGKTTTILALMGLLPPSASLRGTVRLGGRDLLSRGERGTDEWRWRDIATVFQGAMNALNPVRTVGWQICEPMRVHDTDTGTAARERTRELLSLVGLPAAIEHSYPHQLSGGMRQRAAIAMALACEPKVLLADEPTTALDVVVQASILDLLRRLSDELDLALILVTHDLAAAASTCGRLAVMYAGRIVESGPVSSIAERQEHPYTRQLFTAIPDLYDRRSVRAIPGAPPRLDHEVLGCAFAPRCDVRFGRCDHERPVLLRVGASWEAACHLAGPGAPAAAGLPGSADDAAARAEVPVQPVSSGDPALELDGIAVRFPRRRSLGKLLRGRPREIVRAVDGVSLGLVPGEMVALVGESGSGKTTTAHAIVGNVSTSAGTVVVSGHELSRMDRKARRRLRHSVQLVYQDPYESLDPRMRVRAILDEPLRVNRIGSGRKERQRLAAEALSKVGMDPPELFLGRFPHELSGGQRQRVAIAAALVMNPAILVADEPVSMLDVSVRAEVLEVLDTLRRTQSVSIVMITHDLSTAAHYADRIAVMYLGRIVEQGRAADVVAAPRHPYTRALVDAVPVVRGGDRRPTVISGEIPDAAAIPPGCRFAPRCPLAVPECRDVDPPLLPVAEGHSAACVLLQVAGTVAT